MRRRGGGERMRDAGGPATFLFQFLETPRIVLTNSPFLLKFATKGIPLKGMGYGKHLRTTALRFRAPAAPSIAESVLFLDNFAIDSLPSERVAATSLFINQTGAFCMEKSPSHTSFLFSSWGEQLCYSNNLPRICLRALFI